MQPRFATALKPINLRRAAYIGRNPAASPATGNGTIHQVCACETRTGGLACTCMEDTITSDSRRAITKTSRLYDGRGIAKVSRLY